MSLSIPELLTTLSESGLMSADELTTIHQSISSSGTVRTAEEFAKELVRQNHLTKLQAAAVLQGKTSNLVFGEYIVLEKIGSGGMGQVFKARHKPTRKLVALKVLSADAVKNKRLVERFKKEAKAVARLKHPNIVRAYEAGKINRIRYLVMEFVDGENLLDRVKRKTHLSVDETVSSVLQAARGLEYAHSKGIIHRDIKPSNFMRDRKGRVKILDMGLAHVEGEDDEDEEQRLTIPGQMLGTARFMAPEQIEDARKSDVRSDLYSLGCTMYFLLRGKAPYSGETMAHTLMAHVSSPIPDLCKKRPDVPQWVGDVFKKMLAKKPSDRFQTMGELVTEIQKHLGDDLSRQEGAIDEDEDVDEYAKVIAVKGDEGTSLDQLYSDDDEPVVATGEDFAAGDDGVIPEEHFDDQGSPSSIIKRHNDQAIAPPSDSEIPAQPVMSHGADAIESAMLVSQNDPLADRLKQRRQQDKASEFQFKIIAIVIGVVILAGVVWAIFLRK
jgi:serine/threonine protein kinase